MGISITALLAFCAFWLGACPFAIWIGRLLMGKDVRNFGDGNPGTTNVFRAGSIKWGILALCLEMGKGFPFVSLAFTNFKLPIFEVIIVALCAILGHAFSPFLKFKGGKALAVTGGVLLALPPYHIFITVLALLFFFFLFTEQHAWAVTFSFTTAFLYYLGIKGLSWEPVFVFCILVIIIIKHLNDLKRIPIFYFKPLRWLQRKKTV